MFSIAIEGDSQLTELAFPELVSVQDFRLVEAASVQGLELPSLARLTTLSVWLNPALERIAFSALEYADSITIVSNPSLAELSLPRLSGADRVEIYDNAPLDGVALIESLGAMSANWTRIAPDQTQLSLDPCPWTADTECDETSGLCALGTDPVCPHF